jgi:hypothetical protein
MYNNGLGININVNDMTCVNIASLCCKEVVKFALSLLVASIVFIFFYVMQLIIILYMYMSH